MSSFFFSSQIYPLFSLLFPFAPSLLSLPFSVLDCPDFFYVLYFFILRSASVSASILCIFIFCCLYSSPFSVTASIPSIRLMLILIRKNIYIYSRSKRTARDVNNHFKSVKNENDYKRERETIILKQRLERSA